MAQEQISTDSPGPIDASRIASVLETLLAGVDADAAPGSSEREARAGMIPAGRKPILMAWEAVTFAVPPGRPPRLERSRRRGSSPVSKAGWSAGWNRLNRSSAR